MKHPTDGTLRRLVDDPAGVSDPDREHVAGCAQCRADLVAAERDAARVASALAVEDGVDVDAAWARLASATTEATPVALARSSRRGWRAAVTSPVVAGLGAVALVTGASAAAAADWLQIFRTERIEAVEVTEADLVQLPDLSSYGDVEVTTEPEVREVTDAEQAAEISGLEVPDVDDLPRGVTGEPTYAVGDRLVVDFTFSAAEAARAAAAAGEPLPTPPPGLDGSTFRLNAGPGVAAVWAEARGVPALVVVRAVAPTAFSSSGVPFETARDYLLSLPGLPDDVAEQLRGFAGDGTTLPLPVPVELVETSTADVDGVQARVLESRDGLAAGAVWVQAGLVTAVAGTISVDEVLAVARGLEQP